MDWTWDEIYRESLFRSGVKGDDQVVDASMLAKARRTASTVLDMLDGEGIALPLFDTDIEFPTVPGQNKYVLGTGSDTSPASPIRPETIVDGEIQIQPGSQPVYLPLTEITFPQYRHNISVPNNLAQPWNYALNPKYPQSDLYLWPTPSSVWAIRFTCKVKWETTLGNPNENIFSGYLNGFIDLMALKLAMPERLTTGDLQSNATKAKYLMASYTWKQAYQLRKVNNAPTAFPWNVIKAGMNP